MKQKPNLADYKKKEKEIVKIQANYRGFKSRRNNGMGERQYSSVTTKYFNKKEAVETLQSSKNFEC